MNDIIVTTKMPVLALRGMTVFPEQTVHFDVGRMKSALALEQAMKHDQVLYLVPQKDISQDDPGLSGLYTVGTVAKIKQILKSQGENIRVLVTGMYRAKITEMNHVEPFLSATVEKVPEIHVNETLRLKALRREAANLYGNYLDFMERPAHSVQLKILGSDSCGYIADAIAQNSGIDYSEKAKALCQLNPVKRLEHILILLQQEMIMLQMENDIQEKTKAQIDQDQRRQNAQNIVPDAVEQIHKIKSLADAVCVKDLKDQQHKPDNKRSNTKQDHISFFVSVVQLFFLFLFLHLSFQPSLS